MDVLSYVQRELLAMVAAKSANVEKIVSAIPSTVNAFASQVILAMDARVVVSRDASDRNVVNYAIALMVQCVTNGMVRAFAHRDLLVQNVTRRVHTEDMERIVNICVYVKMVVRVIVCQVIANARQDSLG